VEADSSKDVDVPQNEADSNELIPFRRLKGRDQLIAASDGDVVVDGARRH
jgi:hypothetical protein